MILREKLHYNYPLPHVVDVLIEEFLNDPASLMTQTANVTECELMRKVDKGDDVYATIRYSAYSQIPRVVQHILKPDMLTWISSSHWDRKNLVYSFRTRTKYFSKQVHCSGKFTFHGNGNNETDQNMEIDLRIMIPVFGIIIEKEVARVYMKSLQENMELAERVLSGKN